MSQSNQACECCKAHWIEFKLCEELRCTSEKACARLVKHWQGERPPSSHCDDGDCTSKCSGIGDSEMPTVCVFNQPDGGPSNTTDPQRYVFSGVKGDLGVACYDDLQDRYRVVLIRSSDAAIKWGLAVEDSRDGGEETNAPDCPYVKVRPCFDCEGNSLNPDINVMDFVILPERFGYGHDIKQGDVIAYTSAYNDSRKEDGTALPKRRWVIVSDYTRGGLVRFRLTEPLNTGSSADAVTRVFNGTAYVNGDPIRVFDWYGISQAGRGMFQGISDMEGYAVRREKKANTSSNSPDEYDIVWMEQYAFTIAFTLTTDMHSQQANAVVNSSWEQGVAPPSSVTVHDVQNLFSRALTGAKGIAVRSEYADETNPNEPYYVVVTCQQMCKLATAYLSEDMCDAEGAITDFEPATFSPFNQPPDPLPTSAYNLHFLRGRQGDFVTLAWDEHLEEWNVIQVQHQSQKLVTDLRVNGYSVEYKTRMCAVQSCELESPWTVLLTGADCSGNVPSSDSPEQ